MEQCDWISNALYWAREQTQKSTYYVVPFLWSCKTGKMNHNSLRSVVTWVGEVELTEKGQGINFLGDGVAFYNLFWVVFAWTSEIIKVY